MTHRMGGIGDSKILQHKVPRNKKYESVVSRLDTGASVNRYLRKIEDMQTNYRYKKNEIFKRMKVTTFAQLVLQVANVSMSEEDTVDGAENDEPESQETDSISPRSTLEGVIKGVGEVDLKNPHVQQDVSKEFLSKPYYDSPYLLLDVRDHDDYEDCHITTAHNFPIAMLSRTMNNFTPQILEYRNVLGKIIILYDEDERIATKAATTMVERGFDNIFVLSGGLKVLAQKIPEGLTNGSIPRKCVPDFIAKQMKTPRRQNGTHREQTVSDSSKKRFSPNDLDLVNHYLEESLLPQDTGSRLSRISGTSTSNTHRSTRSNVSTSSYSSYSSDRKPWK